MGNVIRIIAALGIVALSTACASTPYPAGYEASAGELVSSHNNREFSLERKATGLGQATWVYARSVYENPVNRPVSHAASLGSLALKSTGGLLRRVVISTAQMPALSGPIPQVSTAEPMDLAAFEETLDRITGTRQDLGRISFLDNADAGFHQLANGQEWNRLLPTRNWIGINRHSILLNDVSRFEGALHIARRCRTGRARQWYVDAKHDCLAGFQVVNFDLDSPFVLRPARV